MKNCFNPITVIMMSCVSQSAYDSEWYRVHTTYSCVYTCAVYGDGFGTCGVNLFILKDY